MADASCETQVEETSETVGQQKEREKPLEYFRTLWILVSRTEGSSVDTVVSFYAANEENARQRAQNWLDTHTPAQCVSLRAFPGGFVMGLTQLQGTIA